MAHFSAILVGLRQLTSLLLREPFPPTITCDPRKRDPVQSAVAAAKANAYALSCHNLPPTPQCGLTGRSISVENPTVSDGCHVAAGPVGRDR